MSKHTISQFMAGFLLVIISILTMFQFPVQAQLFTQLFNRAVDFLNFYLMLLLVEFLP
jgi:hypothetical protein